MIQFRYNPSMQPNSLDLDITVWSVFNHSYVTRAKIDTGASHTSIPYSVAEALRLRKTSLTDVTVAGGQKVRCTTYLASIQIDTIKFSPMDVLGMNITSALIGMDMINLWRMVVDGKQGTVTIEPWSTNPGIHERT